MGWVEVWEWVWLGGVGCVLDGVVYEGCGYGQGSGRVGWSRVGAGVELGGMEAW